MPMVFAFWKKHRVLVAVLAVVLVAAAVSVGLLLREGQSKVPDDFSPFGRADFQRQDDSNIVYPPVNGIPIPTGEEMPVDLDRAVLGDNCSWPQQQAKRWLQLTLWGEVCAGNGGGKPKEVLQPDYFVSLFDSAQKCPGIDDINWKTIFSWLYYA